LCIGLGIFIFIFTRDQSTLFWRDGQEIYVSVHYALLLWVIMLSVHALWAILLIVHSRVLYGAKRKNREVSFSQATVHLTEDGEFAYYDESKQNLNNSIVQKKPL